MKQTSSEYVSEFEERFGFRVLQSQNVVIQQNGIESKRVISQQIDQFLFRVHPKNQPNNCRLIELGKGNMMKLIAPFLLLFSSAVFAQINSTTEIVVGSEIIGAPLIGRTLDSDGALERPHSDMPVINLHSEQEGDFIIHQFVKRDSNTIGRSILAFSSKNATIEYLTYHPRDLSWESYLELSMDEKIAMLEEDIDQNPNRYIANIVLNATYKTPKSQLYGLLTQFENILEASENSAVLMRSMASLISKKEEASLEIGELRKMLKATNTCN